MKQKISFTLDGFIKRLTFGILLFTLTYSVRMSGQNMPALDSQLQNMKQNYKQWLLKMPENGLMVEYDPAPMALDIPKPRFTWIVELDGRARRQTAYQILVASSMDMINTEKGDMWKLWLVYFH